MKLKKQCVCYLKLNSDEVKKTGRSREEDITREGIIERQLTFFVTIPFILICLVYIYESESCNESDRKIREEKKSRVRSKAVRRFLLAIIRLVFRLMLICCTCISKKEMSLMKILSRPSPITTVLFILTPKITHFYASSERLKRQSEMCKCYL